MILAAGRGERMRPLTDTIPKPLIHIQHKALIVHHIERLNAFGFSNIIINTSYLANKIHAALGDGSKFGVHIRYSDEGTVALETGGGIFTAFNLTDQNKLLVVNADVFCDIDYSKIQLGADYLAHLVMVPNPEHHPNGDFSLNTKGELTTQRLADKLTFSGIGIYHRDLFQGCRAGRFALKQVLQTAIETHRVSGELHTGKWTDVGTTERLQKLESELNG